MLCLIHLINEGFCQTELRFRFHDSINISLHKRDVDVCPVKGIHVTCAQNLTGRRMEAKGQTFEPRI